MPQFEKNGYRGAYSGPIGGKFRAVRSVRPIPTPDKPDRETQSSLYPFGCVPTESAEFETALDAIEWVTAFMGSYVPAAEGR